MLRKSHDQMFRKAQMKLFSLIVSILLAVFIALIGSINVITKAVMRGQSKASLMEIASDIEYNEKTSEFTYTRPSEPKNERRDPQPPKPSETEAPVTTTQAATTAADTTVTDKPSDAATSAPSTGEITDSAEQDTQQEYEPVQETDAPSEAPAETQPPETQAPETQPTWPSMPGGQQDWGAWGQQDWNNWNNGQQDWNNWNNGQQEWNKWNNGQQDWNNWNNGQQDWNKWNNGQQDWNNNVWDPNNPWNPWNPWNQMNPWNPWNPNGTPKMYSKEFDDKGVKIYEDKQEFKKYRESDEEKDDADEEIIAESQSFSGEAVLSDMVYTGEPVLEGFTVLSNTDSSTASPAVNRSDAAPAPMAYQRIEPIPKKLGSIEYFILMADREGEYLNTLYNDKISTENAQKYITAILENGDDTDMINSYQFYKTDKPNGTMIVLTDKSYEMEMLSQLKRTTIIIGSIAMVILSILAYFLSKRSIQPIKVAFDKQKQFVSDASHELKTPLTVISANADVLSGEIGQNKWLDYIKAQTDRMSVLVNDLLNLTRLENNTSDFERKYFNLSKAVVNTALPFECQAFENNKKFEVNVEDDIMLSGSEKHIKQMTAIFIDNALKYSNDGGTVRVALKRVGDRKLLSVYNTGEGIKEEDTEKIFERFYRSDASRNRSTGGYGLGLAIAKSVIDKHKFKVHVMNQPGKSVCFMVTMQ